MIPARVDASERGFTILETLVVMVILAIVAAVTIPYFVRLARRQKLVAAAHEIQENLLATRMRAVRANQNASLVITAASGSESQHVLDLVAPDNSPTPTPTPVSKSFIPANSIAFVSLPLNNKVTFGSDGRFVSPPAPTPAVITVEGPVGSPVMNQITIQVNPSGKVQVVTPAVWQ
jgi:prepilin-type N-terminal cleavage/methylation domain-containing protein